MDNRTLERRCEDAGNFEPMNALTFARQHDWGIYATVRDGQLVNLIDEYWSEEDQQTYRHYACIPATMAAVRTFGGY